MTSQHPNIVRSYRKLCLEAVFSEQMMDICFETPLESEENPCVVGSVSDDKRCAIYASLFVAAPEMVALCREMRDWLRPEVVKEPDRSFFWKLVDVISKAEGKR